MFGLKSSALACIDEYYVRNDLLAQAGTLRAALVIQQGATNLNDPAQCQFSRSNNSEFLLPDGLVDPYMQFLEVRFGQGDGGAINFIMPQTFALITIACMEMPYCFFIFPSSGTNN